jgi:hypothetical protein
VAGGEVGVTPPGQITPQGGPNPLGWVGSIFSSLERDILNNPLAAIVLFIIILGIGIIILALVAPELMQALGGAAAAAVNFLPKGKGKSKSGSRSKSRRNG